MRPDPPPRWQYRFRNFERAYNLLREPFASKNLSTLEKEGVIQRFEYTLELAWKLLKDYLEHQGLTLPEITPRRVIRAAFESGLIAEGDAWQRAIDDRNKMAHTYDLPAMEQVIDNIRRDYLALLGALYERLAPEADSA